MLSPDFKFENTFAVLNTPAICQRGIINNLRVKMGNSSDFRSTILYYINL